jgi:hypothetical protein
MGGQHIAKTGKTEVKREEHRTQTIAHCQQRPRQQKSSGSSKMNQHRDMGRGDDGNVQDNEDGVIQMVY